MALRRSVLLVDDETSILQTLRLVFESEGYDVSTADSCAAAIGMLNGGKCRYDAVITDLNMERDDVGLEAARAAPKAQPKPAVVMCAGFARLPNSRAAMDMAA